MSLMPSTSHAASTTSAKLVPPTPSSRLNSSQAWFSGGIGVVAELLLAAAQVRLPSQQARSSDVSGQIGQLVPELRGNTGQFGSPGGGSHQHKISEDSSQPLEHRTGITATVQQIAGGFQ